MNVHSIGEKELKDGRSEFKGQGAKTSCNKKGMLTSTPSH